MKLRALVLFALATLSLGLVVVVSPAAPAWACSCALRPDQEDEKADLIVVGTVTEVTDTGVQLAVESVEKGSLGAAATLGLGVPRGEASCGYDFVTGARYRVNSVHGTTGLCTGIRRLSATPWAEAATPTLVAAAPAPGQSSGRWWFAAGRVLALLGAGLVVVARRRRPTG
ncbi:hypothetical protein [Micromonospora sp. NPDC007230]|uniref:hypothetical protein n=1 Tax=Micromonospora sp. NPDC007230 TaxID=3364237 RepID=UPI00369F4EA3